MRKQLPLLCGTVRVPDGLGPNFREETLRPRGDAAVCPRPCNHAHAAAPEFIDDAIVGDGLADERVGA